MPRYRITISGQTADAMADLIRVHKIQVSDHAARRRQGGYTVDAIADEEQIRLLEGKGYQVTRHEDVDQEGQARQREVGQGNRYRERADQ
jgi:hypothetical protein